MTTAGRSGSPAPSSVSARSPATVAAFTRRVGRSPLLHPILFAAYPVLQLWSANLGGEVPLGQVLTILALMLGGAIVLWLVFRLTMHDPFRAGVATSSVVILFFLFGRTAAAAGAGEGSRKESMLLLAFFTLGAALVVLASRGKFVGLRLTRALNGVAAFLVLINLVPVVVSRTTAPSTITVAPPISTRGLDPRAAGPARDVYYLIFDRYANERTLRDLYGFDDSPFLRGLEAEGMTVVDDAVANYPQTTHSLASSLNMTYLDGVAERVGVDSSDRTPVLDSLRSSVVAGAFQDLGYRYAYVGSWWPATSSDPSADVNYTYGDLFEFSSVFERQTAWQAIAGRLGIGADFDRQEWERVAFQADAVREIARDPSLTFTFAHFLLPHPPYVFDRTGSYVAPDDRPVVEAYVEQLRYTNSLILDLVRTLRAAPGPEPIIIVQSDEGPHAPDQDGGEVLKMRWSTASDVELGRKLRILNALLLPGLDDPGVYNGMTPVNTFRLILDRYFGAALPLLPDRTYLFEDYEHPYRFSDVTDRLAAT